MDARATITVDIKLLQVSSVTQSRRVGGPIFLDDLELQLRPTADFIELKGAGGRHLPACNQNCLARMGGLAGNWLHTSPSRRRPPLFGDRPPHCLKKKGTRASMH